MVIECPAMPETNALASYAVTNRLDDLRLS